MGRAQPLEHSLGLILMGGWPVSAFCAVNPSVWVAEGVIALSHCDGAVRYEEESESIW